ncbi:MAG: pantoate--beta-alanine ligase [Butyricicoccus sp.]
MWDYPRDFEHDCALLTECGCDMVFHPEVSRCIRTALPPLLRCSRNAAPAVRQDPSDSFPRRVHGRFQAVQHRNAG